MSAELIQTYSKASSLAYLIDDKVDKCVFILNVSLCLLIRHAVHLHCTQIDNKSVTKAEIKTDEVCSTEDKMVTGVNIHHDPRVSCWNNCFRNIQMAIFSLFATPELWFIVVVILS